VFRTGEGVDEGVVCTKCVARVCGSGKMGDSGSPPPPLPPGTGDGGDTRERTVGLRETLFCFWEPVRKTRKMGAASSSVEVVLPGSGSTGDGLGGLGLLGGAEGIVSGCAGLGREGIGSWTESWREFDPDLLRL
jgi:hypothetical protein